MATTHVWCTGRYGYGSHLNIHVGGISSERLKQPPHRETYQQILAKEVRALIAEGHCNQAFDMIMESTLTYDYKVKVCAVLFPELKNCT